jgi:hypothetical protein
MVSVGAGTADAIAAAVREGGTFPSPPRNNARAATNPQPQTNGAHLLQDLILIFMAVDIVEAF